MATLEKALLIATQGHLGQTDRFGNPYIYHPLRIMMSMNTEEEQIVAILHDIIEDTEMTLEDLEEEGFSKKIVKAIDLLTRYPEEGQTYAEYIDRMKGNDLAIKIKLGDLKDNMDPNRFPKIDDNAIKRIKKYTKYHSLLTKWLKKEK